MEGESYNVTAQQSAPLVFINHIGPPIKNKAVQTKIRRHVMKGIGKSRRKETNNNRIKIRIPSKLRRNDAPLVFGHPESKLMWADRSDLQPHRHQNENITKIIAWQPPEDQDNDQEETFKIFDRLWSGRTDPFIKYPFDLDQRTKELVGHVFDDRFVNIRPFRDACFPLGLKGEAAFYQVLSNALINLSAKLSGIHEKHMLPLEAITYHAKAVRLANDQIQDAEYATSDAFISAVIAFTCFFSCTAAAKDPGSRAARRIHMDGLDQIMGLRGGIDSLNSNVHIRIPLSWTDVEGAYLDDSPPRYPAPEFLAMTSNQLRRDLPPSPPTEALMATFLAKYPSPISTQLVELLLDFRSFASLLQQEVLKTSEKVFGSCEWITKHAFSLFHRLCCLSVPFDPRSQTNGPHDEEDNFDTSRNDNHTTLLIAHIFRLALTLQLAELRRRFGIPGIDVSVQIQKLQTYLLLLSPASSSQSQRQSQSQSQPPSLSHPRSSSRGSRSSSSLAKSLGENMWAGLESLHLYVVAMGAMESIGWEGEWFRLEMRKRARVMRWGRMEVKRRLEEILWFEDVSGERLEGIWGDM